MRARTVAHRIVLWALAVATGAAAFERAGLEARVQRPSEASTPEGQTPPAAPGGGGARGRGAAPVPQGRAGAPVDLTGVWVSVVTEDWQWRMMTPKKGDYASVPLTPEGRRVADTWEPAMDGQCQAYGVGGIMRMPGRLRIAWEDDFTLRIETDAGVQTRLLRFGGAAAAPSSAGGARTLQGTSLADWQRAGGAFDAFLGRGSGIGGQRWGSLRVVTANHSGGWLRRNGVPYSPNAQITEHFTRFTHPQAGEWFVVTTIVDDPLYLAQPFITSSNFRKEADASRWSPTACRP